MNVNIFSVNASTDPEWTWFFCAGAILIDKPWCKNVLWFKNYIWLFLLFFVTIMLNVNFFTLIHLIKLSP